jgi:predicted metal-dependent hydrolase
LKTGPLHPKAREGIELFNQGEYYEAHEPLEEAWMKTDSPERDLYQGILQIGLAYYQITRGNYRGALKMFHRGFRNLSPLGESLMGIDLTQLQADAQLVEMTLRQLGPTKIDQLDRMLIQPVPEEVD